jgi:hypothetical protein
MSLRCSNFAGHADPYQAVRRPLQMGGRSKRVGGIYLTKLGDLSPHAGQGLLCGGDAEDHGGQACGQCIPAACTSFGCPRMARISLRTFCITSSVVHELRQGPDLIVHDLAFPLAVVAFLASHEVGHPNDAGSNFVNAGNALFTNASVTSLKSFARDLRSTNTSAALKRKRCSGPTFRPGPVRGLMPGHERSI